MSARRMVSFAATPPAAHERLGPAGDLAEGAQRDARAVDHHVDHRGLEACAEIATSLG
jgi:hypothetical protein